MANSLIPIEFEYTIIDNVRVVKVETSVGTFLVPERFVKEGLVAAFLDDLRKAIDQGLVISGVTTKYKLSDGELKIVSELYTKLLEERTGFYKAIDLFRQKYLGVEVKIIEYAGMGEMKSAVAAAGALPPAQREGIIGRVPDIFTWTHDWIEALPTRATS